MVGYVWPKGKRSWEGFAAHVGDAWIVDFDAEEKALAGGVDPGWLPVDSEPPLTSEEEEAFAAGPPAESGLLW